MIFTALTADADGNDQVIAYIGDGKNLETLLEAIKNPDLCDKIDLAIEKRKCTNRTSALPWTEEELNKILVVAEPVEAEVPLVMRNPKKGERRNDSGWITKRQWHKGRDNRLARHALKAQLKQIASQYSSR